MEEGLFTISIFTENFVGLLHRVTSVFTKRKLNIESISASQSEVEGIYRYTISINSKRTLAEDVVQHLEKQIDVLGAYLHEEDETIFQEIALYKVPVTDHVLRGEIEKIIHEYHARILSFSNEYVVIEKTGHQDVTQELFERFEPYGLLEFARSGRVAITKQMKNITSHLKEYEKNFSHEKNQIK